MDEVKDQITTALMQPATEDKQSDDMFYQQLPIQDSVKDATKSSPNQTATSAAIIYEQAIDKTNELIISNLSWANAALLALALPNTIQVGAWSDLANAWFYFIVTFLMALGLAVVPRFWEDAKEVKREIELRPLPLPHAQTPIQTQTLNSNNEQKIEEISNITQNRNNNNHNNNDGSEKSSFGKSASKLIKFVEIQANILGENLEDVLTFAIGNVVAMALRDAAKITFKQFLGKQDTHITTPLWILYALFITTITVTVTIKLGNLFDIIENDIRKIIDTHTLAQVKDDMILFALKKRALNLTRTTLSLCMAWAWRDPIKSLILAMYEGDTTTVEHICIYAITATAFATFSNAVCSQYILLCPRNENIPNLQLGTTSRNLIDKTFANNINYIAAFAWYDCAKSTFEEIGSWEVWQKTLFYWFVAISMQILSFALQYIWEKYHTKVAIAEKGLARVFLSFNKIFDPKGKLDTNKKTGNEENVETFYWAFTVAFITLCIYACGTSSSLFVTLSLKYTISAAYSKYYDLDSGDVPTDSIWMVWIALLISIGISVLIVTYFSRLINAAKKVRRSIVGKEKEKHRKHAQSMRDVRPELAGDNDNDNREYGAGNDDDDNGAVVISHSRTMNDNADGQGYGDSKDMNNDDNNDNNNEYDSEKEKEKRRHEIKSTKTIDEGLGMTSVVLGGGSGGTGGDDDGADDGGDDAGGDAADAGDADGDGQN